MGPFQVVAPLVGMTLNTPAMGAWPTVQAATATVVPGGYYGPIEFGGRRGPSALAWRTQQAEDRVLARRLWHVSIAMTGIDPGLPP